MDMRKNYIIATILMFIVIFAGTYIQHLVFPPAKNEVVETTNQVEPVAPTTVIVAPETNAFIEATEESQEEVEEATYVIETDVVRVTFTNRGGDIISYKLKQHNNTGSTENIEMIENVSEANRAMSISFGDYTVSPVDKIFNVQEETRENGIKIIGFYRTMTVKTSQGTESSFVLAKRYTFVPGEYMFELVVSINGLEDYAGLHFGDRNVAYTLRTAPQIGPVWDKKDRYEYRRFSSMLENRKIKTVTLRAGDTKTAEERALWTGVSGKYFAFLVIPPAPVSNTVFSGVVNSSVHAVENSQLFISRDGIDANVSDVYRVYVGPSSEEMLGTYSSQAKNYYQYDDIGFEQISSTSGVLGPIKFILKVMLQFTYKFVKNWGVAIILVTIFMKILLFPLSWKSTAGTQRLQPYQGKIKELQTKYRDNPQKMQAELTKVYDEAGYRPGCASGCLPLLLQFVIIIAMFQLFNNYFEFRGASFIDGWISDLSLGDSVYSLKSAIPFLGWTEIRLLPVIYVGTQFLSTLMNKQSGSDQNQNMMFTMTYVMPALFFFMLYNAPSGLFVYWITSNILMIIQQAIIKVVLKKEQG